MQADLEQQHDETQLRQRVNYRITGIQQAKDGAAEQHPRHQFSEHSGLAESLRQRTEHLRGYE